jgi:hypothetical protein
LVQRSIVQRIEMGKARFDLVDDEGHGTGLLQRLELARSEVAHTKFPNLALLVEPGKGAGDFVRIAQVIRTVQEIEVNRVDVHSLKGFLAGTYQMTRADIVTIGGIRMGDSFPANPALSGQYDSLPHAGDGLENLPKQAFTSTVAMDIGEIEQGVTGFIRGDHRGPTSGFFVRGEQGGVTGGRDAPATVGKRAGLEGPFAQMDILHSDDEARLDQVGERGKCHLVSRRNLLQNCVRI